MSRWVGSLLVLQLACGGQEPAPPSAEPPSAPEPEPPAPEPPVSPGAGESRPEVPPGSLRGDAANGAALYGLYCSSCHGPGGKGDGPVAASLVPKPADHTDGDYMGSLSDTQLYTVIQKGGAAIGKSPLMAPWGGVVSEEDTKDLIAHIRRLSGT